MIAERRAWNGGSERSGSRGQEGIFRRPSLGKKGSVLHHLSKATRASWSAPEERTRRPTYREWGGFFGIVAQRAGAQSRSSGRPVRARIPRQSREPLDRPGENLDVGLSRFNCQRQFLGSLQLLVPGHQPVVWSTVKEGHRRLVASGVISPGLVVQFRRLRQAPAGNEVRALDVVGL